MTSWPSSTASKRVRALRIGDDADPLWLVEAASVDDLHRWLPPGLTIAWGRIFGSVGNHPALLPVTGRALGGRGVLAWVARDDAVADTTLPGLPGSGRRWRGGGAAWGGWSATVPAIDQGFRDWPRHLVALGTERGPWVRTWLWVDRILERYDALNHHRREAFTGWNWGTAPASTAVGIAPAHPWAMAWEGLTTSAPTTWLDAVGQQPAARSYGAVFARAGVVDLPDHRVVLISGTAAIAADGRTLHPHAVAAQIDATMAQIARIRAATETESGEPIHAVVYLPDAAAERAWADAAASHRFPVCAVRADVCRGDLRFEIEMIVVTPRSRAAAGP